MEHRCREGDAGTVALTRDDRLTLRFQTDPRCATLLRDRLALWLDELGAQAEVVFDIEVAANEAFANALEHPHQLTADRVDVDATSDDGMVTIVVRDYGSWAPGDARENGGHGLPLMRALMDSVDVDAKLDGTSITLRRHLNSRSPSPATKQTSKAVLELRVYVDDPRLLNNLCDYLAADGCLAQPLTHREAAIDIPGAASTWEATETLKMELRSWQAHHAHTRVALLA